MCECVFYLVVVEEQRQRTRGGAKGKEGGGRVGVLRLGTFNEIFFDKPFSRVKRKQQKKRTTMKLFAVFAIAVILTLNLVQASPGK